ncbi:fatty acyl-CoA reductase wat-like [Achroia grisella]|uniref:fatty acyl-CoA reductase wat-like n=1 Tax=Achroia grisella TaxID=688607 RepID=UPI0027D270BC|nr:fatty acyl-CoA reductase wat-like [Achroia grisella]
MTVGVQSNDSHLLLEGSDITYMDMIDETTSCGESQIQKFYSGSTILVTGGTGFLGKLLVEKLLRSCPDIKKLFLLARPKKNKDISKRLQEQFEDVLYDKLRKERPGFLKKITIVEGDVGQIGLGMNEEDRMKVINEVEVIFHGAATVRFDEALKTAVEINVRGTREMLHLARSCSKLRALVHVSTAYSNCLHNEIDEKFYERSLPGEKLIDLVETMDEKIINNITPGLLGDFPNTYAYTKAAAEDIVLKLSKGLPVALFRPAIVIGTAKEPFPGWIDNVYGPTGAVVGAAVGLLHVLNCNPKAIADLVPGDMVVNSCIVTAWKTAKEYPGNHEDAPPPDLPPPVYNYVSSEQNPLTWEKFMKYNEIHGFEVPPFAAVYFYLFHLTPSRFVYTLYCIFLHWIPAYIVDAIAVLIGKKPMLRKAYTKIAKFSDVLSYFALRQWKFSNANIQSLYSDLCEADKQMFGFDMSSISWNEYFYNYVRGVRIFLLKDPMDTVPASVKKHYRLKILHYTFCTILGLGLLRFSWSILSFFYALGYRCF